MIHDCERRAKYDSAVDSIVRTTILKECGVYDVCMSCCVMGVMGSSFYVTRNKQ